MSSDLKPVPTYLMDNTPLQTAPSSPVSNYATPQSPSSVSSSQNMFATPEDITPDDTEAKVAVHNRSPKKLAERNTPEATPLLASAARPRTPPPAWSPPETPPPTYTPPVTKNDNVVVTENPAYGCGNGVTFKDGAESDEDSICSSKRSESLEPEKPKVPDGGWGWVVVASSLVISMIADGISFSFGLLYIEFLKHFGESKSKTSWIGSLFMAVPLLSGPIGSALVDRYGCRWMTILGGIISGLGFTLSAFCNTIEMMYLTFGVIAGLGLGLCYVTAVVCIAYWFDKKRTLATGLGACGTGVGTFVYAPMTAYFIQEYGWRGTTLLLAGTFFNMCVCGAVMRDPEWWTLEQAKQAAGSLSKSGRVSSSCGSISGRSEADNFPGVDEIRRLLKSGQAPEYILTTLATYITADEPKVDSDETEKVETTKTPAYSSVVNLPTFIRQSETVPLEVLESLSANKRVYNVILENYPSLLTCRSLSDHGLNKLMAPEMVSPDARVPVTMSMRLKPQKKVAEPTSLTQDTGAVPLLNPSGKAKAVIVKTPEAPTSTTRDSLAVFKRQFCTAPTAPQTNYLQGIRMHRNSVMYRGAILNINKYRLRASSCPDIFRNSMTTIAKETEEKWYSETLELFKGMMDFSMFLELHFFLVSMSTILLFTWFIVPYFYLAEYVQRYNYSESEASSLLSIIGLTNCFGMIILGWAGDQPWMNVTKTYALCLVMCGLVTLMMPLVVAHYWPLAVLSALFGWFFASMFSFTPVILVKLIPLERFTTAYGLILLCQGVGNLIGPPIAGGLFDLIGYWDVSFYLAGIFIIISGVLIALIPVTRNRVMCGGGTLEYERERDSVSVA